jgi:hypothetical protein
MRQRGCYWCRRRKDLVCIGRHKDDESDSMMLTYNERVKEPEDLKHIPTSPSGMPFGYYCNRFVSNTFIFR